MSEIEDALINVFNQAGEEVGELLQKTNAFGNWRKSIAPKFPNQRLAFVFNVDLQRSFSKSG